MKKNTMMRYASVLLVAVLLTTCVISGTFAKYTTTNPGAESTAQVAKWGVTITANGKTFAKMYVDSEHTGEAEAAAVVAGGEYNVVAPGTNGSMVAMAITGSPEVDVNVSYAATLTLTGWDDNGTADGGTEYCPIEIKVGETTYVVGTGSKANYVYATNVADLITKVQTAINGYSANYEANTDLSTVNTPAVSWSWPYVGDDTNDTKLGDAAAVGKAPTIALVVTTTVTQSDIDVTPAP